MWACPGEVPRLLVVGGIDGRLYMVNTETGDVVSRTDFPAPISAAPGVVDDRLNVATWNGQLWAFGTEAD